VYCHTQLIDWNRLLLPLCQGWPQTAVLLATSPCSWNYSHVPPCPALIQSFLWPPNEFSTSISINSIWFMTSKWFSDTVSTQPSFLLPLN
jgi:hypothetical protein